MARTLEEIDAALAALEIEWADAKPQLLDLRDRVTTTESRISKIIKGLKSMLKRFRPTIGNPSDAFDPWAETRKMDKRAAKWWAIAANETDDLENE